MRKGYHPTVIRGPCPLCGEPLHHMARDQVRCFACGAEWFYRAGQWTLDPESYKPNADKGSNVP